MGRPMESKVVRLVLVGGGHSHQQVVQSLARSSVESVSDGKRFELVLVSDSKSAMYSGMVPSVVAGGVPDEDASVELEALCRASGWRFITGRVTDVKAAQKEIEIDGTSTLSYDLISFDVGSETRTLNGTEAAMKEGANIVLTRPIRDLRGRIDEILTSLGPKRNVKVVVVGGGAAGSELAFALRDKIGNKGEITVITPDTNRLGSFTSKRASAAVAAEFREHNISLKQGKVSNVGVDFVQMLDRSKMEYDLLVIASGAQGARWMQKTDLDLDPHGFIRVQANLQSAANPEVFASGDCAAFPGSLPKAGVFAVRMGPILLKNLRSSLCMVFQGRAVDSAHLMEFKPQTHMLSLLRTSDGMAIGSKWGLVFRGRWVRSMKNEIDRQWIHRFTDKRSSGGFLGPTFRGHPVEGASIILNADVLQENFEDQLSVLDKMAEDANFRQQVMNVADHVLDNTN
mmetsp:Transcript_21301/g.87067  ORF Transcript_21301/g.87067 Transcript_21301/m.87067 type:complete len:457 (-) Transcript_21301:977-2347(-)